MLTINLLPSTRKEYFVAECIFDPEDGMHAGSHHRDLLQEMLLTPNPHVTLDELDELARAKTQDEYETVVRNNEYLQNFRVSQTLLVAPCGSGKTSFIFAYVLCVLRERTCIMTSQVPLTLDTERSLRKAIPSLKKKEQNMVVFTHIQSIRTSCKFAKVVKDEDMTSMVEEPMEDISCDINQYLKTKRTDRPLILCVSSISVNLTYRGHELCVFQVKTSSQAPKYVSLSTFVLHKLECETFHVKATISRPSVWFQEDMHDYDKLVHASRDASYLSRTIDSLYGGQQSMTIGHTPIKVWVGVRVFYIDEVHSFTSPYCALLMHYILSEYAFRNQFLVPLMTTALYRCEDDKQLKTIFELQLVDTVLVCPWDVCRVNDASMMVIPRFTPVFVSMESNKQDDAVMMHRTTYVCAGTDTIREEFRLRVVDPLVHFTKEFLRDKTNHKTMIFCWHYSDSTNPDETNVIEQIRTSLTTAMGVGVQVYCAWGTQQSNAREDELEKFRASTEGNAILVASAILAQGIDLKDLNAVMIAIPMWGSVQWIMQALGRVNRVLNLGERKDAECFLFTPVVPKRSEQPANDALGMPKILRFLNRISEGDRESHERRILKVIPKWEGSKTENVVAKIQAFEHVPFCMTCTRSASEQLMCGYLYEKRTKRWERRDVNVTFLEEGECEIVP